MLTKQTKIIGGVSLLVLALSAAALFVIMSSISSEQEKFLIKQSEAAVVHLQEKELSSLVRLVEGSAEEREELSLYVLNDDDVIDFLALVGDVAKEQGASIEIKSIEEEALNESFDELKIRIFFEGRHESVLKTLTLLESLPYQSRVTLADMKSVSAEGSIDHWEGGVTVYVIKYKES